MVGSTKPQKIDVRVIVASNVDLSDLVKKNKFREDLFYRLNVININLPPLRERGNDILLLIDHFSGKFSDEFSRPKPRFTDEALKVLKDYHWPGNVRELQNVIQSLVIMSETELIDVPDLPSIMRFSTLRKKGKMKSLEEVEYEYIRNVLSGVNGNKTQAANILGIDRKTLREKLKKFGYHE